MDSRDDFVLLEPAEVAGLMKCSRRNARRLMQRMDHVRVGRLLRVTFRAIREFLEDRTCDQTRSNALKLPVRHETAAPMPINLPTVRSIAPRTRPKAATR